MNVGNVLDRARIVIAEMLEKHQGDIHEAYLRADAGLSVGLTIKISPTKQPQKCVVDVDLNFVSERIKDGKRIEVDDAHKRPSLTRWRN